MVNQYTTRRRGDLFTDDVFNKFFSERCSLYWKKMQDYRLTYTIVLFLDGISHF